MTTAYDPAMLRLSVLFSPEARSSWENRLLRDVERSLSSGAVDAIDLAADLTNVGHTALHIIQEPHEKDYYHLRHQYLVVFCTEAGDEAGLRVVVDAWFAEQFHTPHTTARYASVLERVPRVFVGTRAHLLSAVDVLAGEMGRSFSTLGHPVPPWRRPSSFRSKWARMPEQEQAQAARRRRCPLDASDASDAPDAPDAPDAMARSYQERWNEEELRRQLQALQAFSSGTK